MDLAIADLDEDGLADLAVANHETDHVTLLFGIAVGAFERRDHSRFRLNGQFRARSTASHRSSTGVRFQRSLFGRGGGRAGWSGDALGCRADPPSASSKRLF